MTEARRADDRRWLSRRDHPGESPAHHVTGGRVPTTRNPARVAWPVCPRPLPHRLRGGAGSGVVGAVPAIRLVGGRPVPAGLSAAHAAISTGLDRGPGDQPSV